MRGLSLAERCRRFMGKCTACQDYKELLDAYKGISHEWERKFLITKDVLERIVYVGPTYGEAAEKTIEISRKALSETGSQPVKGK